MFSTFQIRNLIRVATPVRQMHFLPELPYKYDALEPIICRDIMYVHHTKHHATYVHNLNVAELKLTQAVTNCNISEAISLYDTIKFNGGGHLNHSIFWTNLTPNKMSPCPTFAAAVVKDFCDMEAMKRKLSTAAISLQGSGWAWLGYNKDTKQLQVATCANQDPLQATTGLIPLLGIDVWEHAYYLQYKNARADYVKEIFNIVNWLEVSRRYEEAVCCT